MLLSCVYLFGYWTIGAYNFCVVFSWLLDKQFVWGMCFCVIRKRISVSVEKAFSSVSMLLLICLPWSPLATAINISTFSYGRYKDGQACDLFVCWCTGT